jgi:hypothetical protein
MIVISLYLAAISFVTPEKRGSILSIMKLTFVFISGVAGYFSQRFYKMYNESEWIKNTLITATFYPTLAFLVFFTINIFLHIEGSSNAVNFGTIFTLILCCLYPSVLIGAFLGLKNKSINTQEQSILYLALYQINNGITTQRYYAYLQE